MVDIHDTTSRDDTTEVGEERRSLIRTDTLRSSTDTRIYLSWRTVSSRTEISCGGPPSELLSIGYCAIERWTVERHLDHSFYDSADRTISCWYTWEGRGVREEAREECIDTATEDRDGEYDEDEFTHERED